MGIAIDLPWKTDRQLAATAWTRCVEIVLPTVTSWSVDMIESQRFVNTLPDSIRPIITARYPRLLGGDGRWTSDVTPEEVQVFVQAWTAPVKGQVAWSLVAHLLQLRLWSGKQLRFASEEFASLVEVYPKESTEAHVCAEIAHLGIPREAIQRF